MSPDDESTAVSLLMMLIDAGLLPYAHVAVKRESLLARYAAENAIRSIIGPPIFTGRDRALYDLEVGRFKLSIIVTGE